MSTAPVPRSNGSATQFQPGNPGKPRGARNMLSRRILEDFHEAWERDGPACLKIMAREEPAKLVQIAAAILPRDLLVSVEQVTPGNLDPADWQLMLRVLDIVKQCVPVEASPGEVFTVIEQALRGHYAKELPSGCDT
jgi:hypothetical protein